MSLLCKSIFHTWDNKSNTVCCCLLSVQVLYSGLWKIPDAFCIDCTRHLPWWIWGHFIYRGVFDTGSFWVLLLSVLREVYNVMSNWGKERKEATTKARSMTTEFCWHIECNVVWSNLLWLCSFLYSIPTQHGGNMNFKCCLLFSGLFLDLKSIIACQWGGIPAYAINHNKTTRWPTSSYSKHLHFSPLCPTLFL